MLSSKFSRTVGSSDGYCIEACKVNNKNNKIISFNAFKTVSNLAFFITMSMYLPTGYIRGVSGIPANTSNGALCYNIQRFLAFNYCCKAIHR